MGSAGRCQSMGRATGNGTADFVRTPWMGRSGLERSSCAQLRIMCKSGLAWGSGARGSREHTLHAAATNGLMKPSLMSCFLTNTSWHGVQGYSARPVGSSEGQRRNRSYAPDTFRDNGSGATEPPTSALLAPGEATLAPNPSPDSQPSHTWRYRSLLSPGRHAHHGPSPAGALPRDPHPPASRCVSPAASHRRCSPPPH
eukprot:scaffold3765_cov122-Isochrysis_galbana.AAC.2